MPEDKDFNYWVVTESDEQYGPFDDWCKAFYFGWENLGFDGWMVTIA